MTTETIFLTVSAIVAGLILLAGAVALLAGRRAPATEPALQPVGPGAAPEVPTRSKYLSVADAEAPPGAEPMADRYRSTIRATWWVVIAAVLIGVGLADVYPARRFEIFALGGLAVLAVVVFHELIPDGRRSSATAAAEVVAAIGLLGGLLVLTGWGVSPFGALLALPALGVALGARPAIGLAAALLASLAYLTVLATDPARPFTGAPLLAAGIVLGTIWLVAVLAVVFSAQQRRLRAAALQLSVTDPLTGLFNRAQIYVDLDQEVRRSRRSLRPFCLLMVDMDGLKRINDTLGHERGDAAIRAIAGVIRRSIRTVDSAYRYAGDEFMVLLPETDFSGAFVVGEKIRQGAEDLGPSFAAADVATSVSVGLVSHPEDGSTDEELMLAVDRAMYAAKAAGKNQISGVPRLLRDATLAAVDAIPQVSALG